MRILVAGDWHGNTNFALNIIEHAQTFDCEAVFQVGDFGFWEHTKAGLWFMDQLELGAAKANMPIYWIDGNHENHALLRKKYMKGQVDQFVEIRPHVLYCPRGHTWEWDDVKFMGFGGAYSIDKNVRTPGTSWWPEEVGTQDEIDHAATKGTVDVLFTHDAPTGSDVLGFMRSAGYGTFPEIAEAQKSRWVVRDVVENAQPELLIHGHYHFPYKQEFKYNNGQCRIIGLDADYTASEWGDTYWVIDTKDFK